MCKVDSFLFVFDLKLGALIIGIVDLVLSALSSSASRLGIKVGADDPDSIAGIIWLIFFICHVIACILLIIGAFQDDNRFVTPWLVTTFIKIIVLIVYCVQSIMNHAKETVIAWYIIFILLTIYFWICVYSYFKKIGGRLPGE